MIVRRFIGFVLVTVLLMTGLPVLAQDSDDPIQIRVEAGYDQRYRPEYWVPLRVHIRNDGTSITGKITVRPARSGRIVSNAYSTPIDLPAGSEKTAFLYIEARDLDSELVVELVDNDGVRFAEQSVALYAIDPVDVLHVVVSRLDANTIPLNEVAPGGTSAHSARWQTQDIPPDVMAMEAIDTLIFFDASSETLTIPQREAIEQWVTMGGHLIVIGGSRWQETTAALETLLPLIPNDGQTINDLQGIATFSGNPHIDLSGRTIAAVGDVQDDARILAETESGIPLVARHERGLGTVDFVAVDPTQAPLGLWEPLPDFWFTLLMSAAPVPGWTRGFIEQQHAARTIAILPNIDLLPSVASMAGFIFAYILLIGPINYFTLSRMNRRGWAWGSIPLLILLFTGLAWTVGFNLRGSEILLSRVGVIQTYQDAEMARIDQLIGILSPRRETYTLTMPDRRMLRVIPELGRGGFLQQNITQSTSDIVQGENFRAESVAIDGGIFANFGATGMIPAPAISGSVSISPNSEDILQQQIRGVVRNDSDVTLQDAIIIMNNQYYRLSGDFASGDVVNFDSADMLPIRDDTELLIPSPSPLESVYALDVGASPPATGDFMTLESSRVVLGDRLTLNRHSATDTRGETETQARRRAFLASFMRDQYGTISTGENAFLIGWAAEDFPLDIELVGTSYRPVDMALHIVQLDTEIETIPETVTLEGNQFMWSVTLRDAVSDPTAPAAPIYMNVLAADGGMNDLVIVNLGIAEARFVPLPNAVLSEVDTLKIMLERSSSFGRNVDVAIWNWDEETWDMMTTNMFESYEINNPDEYIGPNNMVDLRISLIRDVTGATATARLQRIKIVQIGRF